MVWVKYLNYLSITYIIYSFFALLIMEFEVIFLCLVGKCLNMQKNILFILCLFSNKDFNFPVVVTVVPKIRQIPTSFGVGSPWLITPLVTILI